jgi:poly(A) polymerase
VIPKRLQRLLDADATPIRLAERFQAAGFSLYLVGGSLRDLLLGRAPGDLDFATDAHPSQIKEVVRGWADQLYTAGEAYGTVGVVRDGNLLEVTTFRREVYRRESRKPSVEFSDDIDTDLSRRDFTINALAMRLPDPEMRDPFGGLDDLGARRLRTPLDPEISFGDDPLRMLRLYRFIATLGFKADHRAEGAVREMHGRLAIVSAERIREELTKLITAPKPGEALWRLVDSGLADEFLPELPALALEQDPQHRHKDILAHTIAVVDKVRPELVLRLAALFHDVGKPKTRSLGPKGASFHHHEVVGARMTKERLRALRYPKKVVEDVARLVYLHLRPHTYVLGWTDRAVRRYVRDAGHLLDELNHLVRADVTTANRDRARTIQRRIDELEERIAQLRRLEELDRLRPPIDGHAVMAFLGIGPGPLVGEALEVLTEHRIDHGPYSVEEAYELLQKWAAAKGLSIPGA